MRIVRFLWRRRRRAALKNIYGRDDDATILREMMYEYAELRRMNRIPLLGRSWMPKVPKSEFELGMLEGRRQMMLFLEGVAGLSPQQLDDLESRTGTPPADD